MKSVYAEYLPSSWDEEKVKEYFTRFGEIESVALAKDLSSSRRQDFAFINYTTRDAALTCIEAVNRERLEDDCSKVLYSLDGLVLNLDSKSRLLIWELFLNINYVLVKMAVSLAKPIPKRKETRHTSNPSSKQHLEEKAIAFQSEYN